MPFFRLDVHRCIETGIFGDGGLNVETIDGGVRVGVESFFCRGANDSDGGGIKIDLAGPCHFHCSLFRRKLLQ